jgi:hypothetical protein
VARNAGRKQVPQQTIPDRTHKSVPEKTSFDAATKYEASRFRFSSSHIDLSVGPDSGCEWEWGPDLAIWKDVLHYLGDFSEKTWGEIEGERTGGRQRHKKHHAMEVASLPSMARTRLLEHFGDDAPDTLFRFRLSGKGRLWGLRDGAIFHLLWYDPLHRVYPTDPN